MDYLNTYKNKLVIDHYHTHLNGSIDINKEFGIIPTLNAVKSSGANSILLTFTKKDGKPAYIKVAHGQDGRQEVAVDTMLMESLLSRLLEKEKIIAGISFAWQMPDADVKELSIKFYNRSKIVNNKLYNAAMILKPSLPSSTLYKISTLNRRDVMQQIIRTPLFEQFLIDVLRLGYEYGFVHNDLHSGNVLALLNGQNKIMGYKIIDLGRAYATMLDVPSELCRNEYAKLSTPDDLLEFYDTFTERVSKIDTLQDCLQTIPENPWIKPVPLDSFRRKTYILFDLIGLMNGLGFFDGIDVKTYDTNSFLNRQGNNVYSLLEFWYVKYIRSTNYATCFYEKQWIEHGIFKAYVNTFYGNNQMRSKIDAIIDAIISPSILGSMLTSLRISGGTSNTVPDLIVEPGDYGEALLDIEDLKKQHTGKQAKPRSSRSRKTQMPPLPQAISVYGGKKRVSK